MAGTAAYQTYSGLIGARLTNTNAASLLHQAIGPLGAPFSNVSPQPWPCLPG